MAIAQHHPEKLYARNRGMLSMSKGQLHDFAATPEKGLPEHVGNGHPHRNLGKFLHSKKARVADRLTALRNEGKFHAPRCAGR